MTAQQPTARETYEAYLRREITPEEVERRAREWYASQDWTSKPPKKD